MPCEFLEKARKTIKYQSVARHKRKILLTMILDKLVNWSSMASVTLRIAKRTPRFKTLTRTAYSAPNTTNRVGLFTNPVLKPVKAQIIVPSQPSLMQRNLQA